MLFRLFVLFTFLSVSLKAEMGFSPPWGKDAELKYTVESTAPTQKSSPLVKLAEQVILFHQNVISPVDGPRSHFRPSSSRYMLLAMQRNGFFKGFIMGCDRLLRENDDPWVYRTTEVDGKLFKYDPPKSTK